MAAALEQARRAAAMDEVPIGAVVMRGEDIVESASAIDAESRADERRDRVARHRNHGRDRDRADGRAAG